MANTARRLLCLWVRPTLFDLLEERAREHDQQLDDEVRDILSDLLEPRDRDGRRRRGRLLVLPTVKDETPASLPATDSAGARETEGRSRA